MSNIDQVLENLSYNENMYLKDLKESMYRQGRRTTPFRFSDYPRLRRHIIERDRVLYDLPPVVEDRYTTYDDEGAVRDMASSVLAKRYRQNRRNRNIRTLKARDRLDLARMIEAGLPEDIVRNVVKHRNKIDVHNEQFGSSRRRKKKKNKKKTRRRQTIRSVEPANEVVEQELEPANEVVEQELEPELEPELEQELNLLSLAPDIQETIGKNLRNIKLQKLSRENSELMENYKNKVSGDLPLLNYGSLLNTQFRNTNKEIRYDDVSIIVKVFNLPSDVANLLIGAIQHFELNNLQELLKFLAKGNNLNEFIFTFTLSLRQTFEYTPIEIQQYINNFLKAINYRFLNLFTTSTIFTIPTI